MAPCWGICQLFNAPASLVLRAGQTTAERSSPWSGTMSAVYACCQRMTAGIHWSMQPCCQTGPFLGESMSLTATAWWKHYTMRSRLNKSLVGNYRLTACRSVSAWQQGDKLLIQWVTALILNKLMQLLVLMVLMTGALLKLDSFWHRTGERALICSTCLSLLSKSLRYFSV